MKVAVRYFSRTGNTEKVANAIADAVGVQALDVLSPLTEKVDILFLGSAVYAAGIDEAVKSFIRDNASNIGKIVNFSTAAVLASTYKQVQKIAQENGVAVAPQEFHCRGAFSVMHRSKPDAKDLSNAATFAKNIVK